MNGCRLRCGWLNADILLRHFSLALFLSLQIIRGTQFSGQESDGSSKYIMGDPRDQYAAEGLIIGVLNVAAAVAVIFMNTRSFSTDAPTVKGAKLSPLQHLYNAIAPFFTPGVCLVAFLALWFQVISIYSRSVESTKHRPPTRTPADNLGWWLTVALSVSSMLFLLQQKLGLPSRLRLEDVTGPPRVPLTPVPFAIAPLAPPVASPRAPQLVSAAGSSSNARAIKHTSRRAIYTLV
jgi:hypothetical protein